VKAALTGHLVLSTLHTNDAPGTISRLLNMGIEPFLVTASLNAVIAQRLCRRLCPDCKAPAATDEQALLDAGIPADQIGSFQPYDKVGCKNCNDRGFKGRVAVYEVMPMWDGLKELVINGASTAELKQEAIRLGFQTLRMSALNKVREGTTPWRRRWATPPRTASRRTTVANLHQLLKAMVEKGASDLHITTGSPPQLRIDGKLVPLKTNPSPPWRRSSSATRSSPTPRSTDSRRRPSSTSPSA